MNYPHPRRYQSYRIVYFREDDIFAVNPKDSNDTIPLTQEDVIEYDFNIGLFREVICEILGFRPARGEIGPYGHTFPVGNWEPGGGQSYPVHWITARDPRDCVEYVRELLLDNPSPMIFLTPSRRKWDMDTLAVIAKYKSTMAPLDELVIVDGEGRWSASPLWNEALIYFYRMLNPPAEAPELPPNIFRKRGEMWVIRFEGEETYLKDSVGLQSIGQLLMKPHVPIFVMELRALLNGQNPDSVAQPFAREDVVDQETLTALKHRYLELQADLGKAQRDGNAIMEEETEREMEKIIQYLGQIKALGGEPRKANDDFEKARSATSKAFWRSVNQIRGDLPRLAAHLEKSCVVGMVCNYTPERNLDWVL